MEQRFHTGQTVRVLQFPSGRFHENLLATVAREYHPPSLLEAQVEVWFSVGSLPAWEEFLDSYRFRHYAAIDHHLGVWKATVDASWLQPLDDNRWK